MGQSIREELNEWLNKTFNDLYLVEYDGQLIMIQYSPKANVNQFIYILNDSFGFDFIDVERYNKHDDNFLFVNNYDNFYQGEYGKITPMDNFICHAELIKLEEEE